VPTTTQKGLRSNDLANKREIALAFFGQPSPRVITAVVAVVAVTRIAGGAPSWADLMVVAATLVLIGPVEWFIHLHLLHAPEEAWTSRRLGTGAGHREHHIDPPLVRWLLLSGVDAAVFSVMIAIGTAAWSVPAVAVLATLVPGQGLLAPYLTALLAATLALGHYEWTHLFVHTRYRPRTRYYRRLARNHRRHHYRNENYWLGVTSNVGDRIMRTYPADTSDVPLSETARTLS
jgi:hypothetical protein